MKQFSYHFLTLAVAVAILLPGLAFSAYHSPAAPALAQGNPVGTFEEAPCPQELPEGVVEGEDIRCGYLTVPVEHANPEGTTLRLAVAILPSTGATPAEPLFMAQGGPGGSTIDFFGQAMFSAQGDIIRESRDIVLVEQRGTLYSEPFLRCEESTELTLETLNQDLDPQTSTALALESAQACYNRFTGAGVNLSGFDSVENAADMNMARQALGYDQIYFYGVSYGSLLAQHYLRDFPETSKGIILDAVVPLSLNFVPEVAVNAQRVFDLLFATCAADSYCSGTYPDLEGTFYNLIASLDANPVSIALISPFTGETYDSLLDGYIFTNFMFNLFYVTDALPLLPRIITEMTTGNYSIYEFIQPYFVLDFTLADAMYYSVVCSEDADFTAADINLENVDPYVGQVFDTSYFLPLCADWQVEAFESVIDAPVVSDVPTLVLSGEFDPITPPANGDIAAEQLSNAYIYTIPAAGHGVFDTDCGSQIFLAFLADPTTAPDGNCIAGRTLQFQ